MFGIKKRNDFPIIGYATSEGARGKRNDDRFDHFTATCHDGGLYHVLLVADGVTSAEGSAQASEIAVRELRKYLSARAGQYPPVILMENAIHHAHRKILQISQIYPEWRTMCTTVVVAMVHQESLYVAHMGDSRAYLIRQNDIVLLTKDHTWVQEAIDDRIISAEVAKTHPKRHIVKRFLGIQEHISVDCTMFGPLVNGADVGTQKMVDRITLLPSDIILLCTDGLTEKVSEKEMQELIRRSGKRAQKAAESLLKVALKRKEADNITALLMMMPDIDLSYAQDSLS